jgi:hypothetical protein
VSIIAVAVSTKHSVHLLYVVPVTGSWLCRLTKWFKTKSHGTIVGLVVSTKCLLAKYLSAKYLSAKCMLAKCLLDKCLLAKCLLFKCLGSNVCWSSNLRWSNVRWPNVCWPNVCWPNVCWPNVCWPNACRVKHLLSALLSIWLLALPTYIRLGCKRLLGTNNLTYYKHS